MRVVCVQHVSAVRFSVLKMDVKVTFEMALSLYPKI